MRIPWSALAAAFASLAALGCNTLLGLDPGRIPPPGGGGATSTSGTTGGSGGAGTACTAHRSIECTGMVWASAYGDLGTQHAAITGMAVDDQGSILIAGYFGSTITFGSTLYAQGAFDYFLAKLGPDGQPHWAKRFGSASADAATYPIQVAVGPGGQVTLAGAVNGAIDFGGGSLDPGGKQHDFDVFVARFDDQGNHRWSKRFGDATRPHVATQIVVTPAGDVVVGGWFQGSLDLGLGPLSTPSANAQSGFLAKLAGESGAAVWTKALDAMQTTDVGALAIDPTGNLVVAGTLDGDVELGGPPLTGYGIYLARFDGNGGYGWAGAETASGSSFAAAAAVDRDGFALVAGTFGGTLQFGAEPALADSEGGAYLVKLDPAGKPVWSKALPTTRVAVDGQADIVVAGSFTQSTDLGGGVLMAAGGGQDMVIGKLDASGAHRWSQRFGDAASQYATAVAVLPGSNRVVVAAAGAGSVDFGGGAITGNGAASIWLALFEP